MALALAGCAQRPMAPGCPDGGATRCSVDARSVVTCSQGVSYSHPCDPMSERCDDGECKPIVCPAGNGFCDRGTVADSCNATGTVESRTDCAAAGLACVADASGARCVMQLCVPGRVDCSADGSQVIRCTPDGQSTEVVQTCADPDRGGTCMNGVCVDRCTLVENGPRSSLGCRFLVATLGHGTTAAALVWNPQTDLAATVKLRNSAGMAISRVAQPGQTMTIPWLAASDVDGSRDAPAALQLSSSVPIHAWQLSDATGGLGDGALLLPEHALGARHVVAVDGAVGAEEVAIVGTAPGTMVTVTPTVALAAGSNVPAYPAGAPLARALDRGEQLVLVAASPGLSGTTVEANAPVAVFAGATAAGDPARHVETAVLPWSALGKSYSLPSGTSVIVAREDDTHVTTRDGTVALAAGASVRFDGPRALTSDRAVAAVAVGSGIELVIPDEQALTSSGAPLPGNGSALVCSRAAAFAFDGAALNGALVDGAFAFLRVDGLAGGLHTVDGTPHALYLDDGAALTVAGPLALDPVNP